MRALAEALFEAERTRARNAKIEALARGLREVAARDAAALPLAARLMTGNLLPTGDERTLGAGGALVFEAACIATGMAPEELGTKARRSGDIGTAIGEALAERPGGIGLGLDEVAALVETLASTGVRAEKLKALSDAFASASALEARYLARAILGEMRVGAAEGIVETAVAKAFDRPAAAVRRAAALVSDVGLLAELAHDDRLDDAKITVGRPVGFMLATPLETARGADLTIPHAVEDKIDGIRAQIHVSTEGVHVFARGKGAVTKAFPDIARPLSEAAAAGLPPAILDGEIVVVADDGKVRPFSALQGRLNKVDPDEELLRSVPVRCLVYDLLLEEGESLLALPFTERRARLEGWTAKAPPAIVLHASRALGGEGALDAEFDAARARGSEGLVLKRLDSTYEAGVRGFAWLKVKRAFATLDVVVVAAERGHGKRAGVLSDYTFAVRGDEGELLVIGKAYSGLTDLEIDTMTSRLESLALAPERHGYLPVRPEIVLEVAFDGLQRSNRHSSGFALRFPRIAHIRNDKRPEDADTLETVRGLFESQLASGHREEAEAPKAKAPAKKGGRKSGRKPDVRQKSKQLKLFDD
ncbi:ATP-dependent DNA ligase [Labilithrix luteola]|uniref:DNA ligase (ATP) n=1 Tax=Labilithrix luteola TaxID=1391654 RepID=A0A0K1QC42_9BACT|nr:ATP-dependent DNA ligase [Labilithrix luteola]AKV03293.1 ATP-dependent DNA ligase [Labilithrix luteola]